MILPELFSKFIRYYAKAYRIEHELDLIKNDSSFWSYELIVQYADDAQLAVLKKAFAGENCRINADTRDFIYKAPVREISESPTFELLFGRLESCAAQLPGAGFELQMLTAHKDSEYNPEFSREQKWQWLISSTMLCEFFVIGKVSEEGKAVYDSVFHSCHQSDHNREITEECPIIISRWEDVFREVCKSLCLECSEEILAGVVKPEYQQPVEQRRTFAAGSLEEANEILAVYNLCGIGEQRGIKLEARMVSGSFEAIELADIVFSRRHSNVYQLFGNKVPSVL